MNLEITVDPFFVPEKVTANVKGGKTHTIFTSEMKPEELAEMADTWRKELFKKAAKLDPSGVGAKAAK